MDRKPSITKIFCKKCIGLWIPIKAGFIKQCFSHCKIVSYLVKQPVEQNVETVLFTEEKRIYDKDGSGYIGITVFKNKCFYINCIAIF